MKIETNEYSSMNTHKLRIDGCRNVVATLYIEKETILSKDSNIKPRKTINWPAFGEVDIDTAEKFALGLLELVRISKNKND